MKIVQQCCTLPQAKRLKELGVKQEGQFSWFIATDCDDDPGFNSSSANGCHLCGHPVAPYIEEISAFTVAELGQMLPDEAVTIFDGIEGWRGRDSFGGHFGPFPTEAECRAAMLIKLLEDEYIPLNEVNARL